MSCSPVVDSQSGTHYCTATATHAWTRSDEGSNGVVNVPPHLSRPVCESEKRGVQSADVSKQAKNEGVNLSVLQQVIFIQRGATQASFPGSPTCIYPPTHTHARTFVRQLAENDGRAIGLDEIEFFAARTEPGVSFRMRESTCVVIRDGGIVRPIGWWRHTFFLCFSFRARIRRCK